MKRSLLHFSGAGIWFGSRIAVLLLLLPAGCATKSVTSGHVSMPSPPSEETRAQLGALSVVVTELKATEFTQPMGKGKAAGRTAGMGFVAAPVAGGALGGGYGFAAGLFLAPVAGTAGAIYGAFAGITKDDYQRVCTNLQVVVGEATVAARLERGVADAIRFLTPGITVVPTNASKGAAQSILEVTPAALKLGGPSVVNPPLTLVIVVRVRLLRAADGAELYSAEFSHHGASHPLREWADDGGTRLRDGIAVACQELPAQIVERMFLVYPLPPSPAQSRIVPWTTKD